jgi:hypothetical protein
MTYGVPRRTGHVRRVLGQHQERKPHHRPSALSFSGGMSRARFACLQSFPHFAGKKRKKQKRR